MRCRFKWFIHLRAQGISKGDEHPAYTPLWGMALHCIGRGYSINWIRFQMKPVLWRPYCLFNTGYVVKAIKSPFDLPTESESGFTVNLNPDSIIEYPLITVRIAVWSFASLLHRFTDTNVYGTCSIKIWNTRLKTSVDIRIFLHCVIWCRLLSPDKSVLLDTLLGKGS